MPNKIATFLSASLMLSCCLFAHTTASSAPAPSTTVGRSQGLAAWQQMYSVMVSPRCLNCHTATNFPQQGDDRHRHRVNVVRGPEGHGVPSLRCVTCHQTANADSTGVPGGPNWHLAPLSMAWQDRSGKPLSSAAINRIVANRATNGNLDGPGLIKHMQDAELVRWAWHPGVHRDGTPRSVPPLTHEQLVSATRIWVQAGMPCPQNP